MALKIYRARAGAELYLAAQMGGPMHVQSPRTDLDDPSVGKGELFYSSRSRLRSDWDTEHIRMGL